jgi:hypothetical protein
MIDENDSYSREPCEVCGNIPGTTDICTSCPKSLVPHPRHDIKAISSRVNGRCPACRHGDHCVGNSDPGPKFWDLCACGFVRGMGERVEGTVDAEAMMDQTEQKEVDERRSRARDLVYLNQ